jgi:hypothetical protein
MSIETYMKEMKEVRNMERYHNEKRLINIIKLDELEHLFKEVDVSNSRSDILRDMLVYSIYEGYQNLFDYLIENRKFKFYSKDHIILKAAYLKDHEDNEFLTKILKKENSFDNISLEWIDKNILLKDYYNLFKKKLTLNNF